MKATEHITRMRSYLEVEQAIEPGANLVTRGVHSTKADDRNREIVVIATTDDVDLENEVILPDGIDLSHFEKNRKVFVDHDYGYHSCVGVIRKLMPYSAGGRQGIKARVALNHTALADDILKACEAGMGPGASIGFAIDDASEPTEAELKAYKDRGGRAPRMVVRRCRLLELSLTHMPCNVSCQGVGVVDETRAAGLRDLVTKSVISRESARALGWRETPRKRLVLCEEGSLVMGVGV